MKNITGTVAEGEDFFGRDKEQRQMWSKLQDNANLALLAPRRVGKTSLLKRLEATANHTETSQLGQAGAKLVGSPERDGKSLAGAN